MATMQSLLAFLEAQQTVAEQKTAIGSQLREAREALGINQSDLAFAAGVSTAYVSMIESGQRTPTVSKMTRIVAALEKGEERASKGASKDLKEAREEKG